MDLGFALDDLDPLWHDVSRLSKFGLLAVKGDIILSFSFLKNLWV